MLILVAVYTSFYLKFSEEVLSYFVSYFRNQISLL